MINTTLCYIEKDGKYLMLNRNKKKNDLNEGKWIGIGGKFKNNETADECLKREVLEETGFQLTKFQFHGIIHFRSDRENEEMYLYSAEAPEDTTLIECNEGTLSWIDKDNVLELPIWEGDRLFLKKLIAGESRIEMTLEYKGDNLIHAIDHLSALCFTGHKDFTDDRDEVYNNTIDAIEHEYTVNGIYTFIAGGARGYDTLAASAVLELREKYPDIKLILALPFRDQPKVEGDWDVAEENLFYKVLDSADDVIYVCDYAPKNKYHARDRFMVDHSIKVISLLRHKHSGTEYTVNYALKCNKEVIRL